MKCDPAIVIGAYALTDFLRLNLTMCRKIFPSSPVLVSDDCSFYSPQIKELASEMGAMYLCSERRRTHVSGDWQAFINGAVFGKGCRRPVLKLSQRFVPRLPDFRKRLMKDWKGRGEAVALLPGRLEIRQIARPLAKLYTGFPHLTDCVMFDPEAITAEELSKVFALADPSDHRNYYSEHLWFQIMQQHQCKRLEWLSNHTPMEGKLFLRKACATQREYQDLAAEHNMAGTFDLREWNQIEGINYRCAPL